MAELAELVGGPLCGRQVAVHGRGPAVLVFVQAPEDTWLHSHQRPDPLILVPRQVLYRRTRTATTSGARRYLYTRAP